MDDVASLLKHINDVNLRLTPYNKRAISYLLQKQKDINLSEVFSLAQDKYGCETSKQSFRFVVMVVKLACGSQRVKALVKEIDPSLNKVDGPGLLNECLTDDDDYDEALISKLSMRAVLISLDTELREKGDDKFRDDKKFRDYICIQLHLSADRFDTNFQLYNTLENSGKIEPNNLEIIRRTLSMDGELQYALTHFGELVCVCVAIYHHFRKNYTPEI